MQALAEAVAHALRRSGFTPDGLLDLLGPEAFAALGRGERVPAEQVLADTPDTTLTTLVGLFLLGDSLAEDLVAAALPLSEAQELGLVELVEAEDSAIPISVRPLVHIQPYPVADDVVYVVSDQPLAWSAVDAREPAADHVVGVGGASVTLATLTPRHHAGRCLDLGTGCGIQALLLADHGDHVVATDRSDRALRMAEMSALLSRRSLDLRSGSLFEPVAGEEFDLIAANPPFVISPSTRFVYRESTLRADDLSRDVVRDAVAHLAPGGVAVVLANWLHTEGEDWQDRVRSWTDGLPCSMWAVQREVQTLSEYVELWLRDSGDHGTARYERLYSEWLTALRQWGATAVGFGWVVLRRQDDPEARWAMAEELAEAPRLPTGEDVDRQLVHLEHWHRAHAADLLGAHVRWADGVVIETTRAAVSGGLVGMTAWRADGWRPAEPIDRRVAEVLADTGTVAERIDRLEERGAESTDDDGLDLIAVVLVALRRLVAAGLVTM